MLLMGDVKTEKRRNECEMMIQFFSGEPVIKQDKWYVAQNVRIKEQISNIKSRKNMTMT